MDWARLENSKYDTYLHITHMGKHMMYSWIGVYLVSTKAKLLFPHKMIFLILIFFPGFFLGGGGSKSLQNGTVGNLFFFIHYVLTPVQNQDE